MNTLIYFPIMLLLLFSCKEKAAEPDQVPLDCTHYGTSEFIRNDLGGSLLLDTTIYRADSYYNLKCREITYYGSDTPYTYRLIGILLGERNKEIGIKLVVNDGKKDSLVIKKYDDMGCRYGSVKGKPSYIKYFIVKNLRFHLVSGRDSCINLNLSVFADEKEIEYFSDGSDSLAFPLAGFNITVYRLN